MRAEWRQNGDMLTFTIRADRFLRNMVRAIVGTLVDVGRGRYTVAQFEDIVRSRDLSRSSAGAPPQGLFLAMCATPTIYSYAVEENNPSVKHKKRFGATPKRFSIYSGIRRLKMYCGSHSGFGGLHDTLVHRRCACTVRAMACAVAPSVRASVGSPNISVTFAPTRWAPIKRIVRVEYQFHESVAVTRCRSLTRCREGEAPDLVVYTRGTRLLLGHTYRRHLGRGEYTRRDSAVIERLGLKAAYMLHAAYGLGRSDMRQAGVEIISPMAYIPLAVVHNARQP